MTTSKSDRHKSIRDRLKHAARQSGVPFNKFVRQEALKELLCRGLKQRHDFLLKGALSLEAEVALLGIVLNSEAMTTDADLATRDAVGDLVNAITLVCSDESSESFEYQIAKDVIKKRGAGRKLTVTVFIDGRRFTDIHLDIGTARVDMPNRQVNMGMDYKKEPFGDLSVECPEVALADKLHAFAKDRGGRSNTRYRDLPDMLLIGKVAVSHSIRLEDLRYAVEKVFGDEPIPERFPEPPAEWPSTLEVRADYLPNDKSEIVTLCREFWDPVLSADWKTRKLCSLSSDGWVN